MNKRYYSKKNVRFSYDKNQKVRIQPLKKTGIIMAIVIFSAVLILIVYTILDTNLNPPGWWRFDRLEDKKAILTYVEENYPETIKITGSKFPFQYPAGSFEHSVMYFDLNGVNFDVSAWKGKVTGDTYYEARADKYIREKYINNFMNDRGLTPNIKISFISPSNHYGILGKDVLGDIYDFEGTILVKITQKHINGVSAPNEIVWFYDFYQYWMKNCDFPNCAVYLYYPQNNEYATSGADYHIWFEREKKTFSSKKDFYNHFTT